MRNNLPRFMNKARVNVQRGMPDFFNDEDIEKIIKAFDSKEINPANLKKRLNFAIESSVFSYNGLVKPIPKKNDEIKLLTAIKESSTKLNELLKMLRFHYGHETYNLIKCLTWQPNTEYDQENLSKEHSQNEPIPYATAQFLDGLLEKLNAFSYSVSAAVHNLKESPHRLSKGKKQNLPNEFLISNLIEIYESLTKKKAGDNFKQSKKATSGYQGEFYTFAHSVFLAIDNKYKTDYPDQQNIFKIFLESSALGSLIRKNFNKARDQSAPSIDPQ